MVKQELRVKAGYELIHEKLVEKKEAIEEEIRKQVAEETALIDAMLEHCTKIVEVEVEDEEQPTDEVVEG